jgi:hypothetical protein
MLKRTSRLVAATMLLCLSLPAVTAAASGSAVRTMETEQTILRIVAQCMGGLASDVGFSKIDVRPDWLRRGKTALADARPMLRIDGQPRTGFFAWLAAANQVAGYALDTRHVGSVELAYRVTARGYNIDTTTAVRDGFVRKTFSTDWTEVVPITKRLTREIPIHAQIRITADEHGETTSIRGTAYGDANTAAFKCGAVRRFADVRAAGELDAGLARALREIETKGRGFYGSGADIANVLDAMRAGIQLGQRIGRLRR